MPTVLLIDNDRAQRFSLHAALRARTFDVVEAAGADDGIVVVTNQAADIVIVELDLADLDELDTLARIRAVSDIPVIVLSQHQDPKDKVRVLDTGVDDYVTKPFDIDELAARIRVHLRRRLASPAGPLRVEVADVVIDLHTKTVTRAGQRVSLTRTELALLEAMVSHPGRLLSHQWLLQNVWGEEYGTETSYLRTFVGQLRRKLGDDAAHPKMIATEPGLGYRWVG